eukprot:677495-Prorocentrum_minimum.AAC.1
MQIRSTVTSWTSRPSAICAPPLRGGCLDPQQAQQAPLEALAHANQVDGHVLEPPVRDLYRRGLLLGKDLPVPLRWRYGTVTVQSARR